MKRLLEIQEKLKAPKNQFNDFWKYKYRNCEDILEALKPLLKEQWLTLLFVDDISNIWDRYYVESRANLYDTETWKLVCYSTALAREEETKKWMDASQITWSSSSYARKYALCWMFLIDDWIDADSTNKWEQKQESKEIKKDEVEKKRFNKEQLDNLKTNKDYLKKFETSEALLQDIYSRWYSVSKDMKMKIADVRASIE